MSVRSSIRRFFSYDLAPVALSGILLMLAFAVTILMYPFFSYVEPDESVIKDCDGELTVWRAPADEGIRWDGFCRTATYDDTLQRKFREEVVADGVRVTLRGRYAVLFPREHPDRIREIYREYGQQDAFMGKAIDPVVREEILAAAGDPAWHRPTGGIIKREIKNALEYGLRRLSPTGRIWTSPEARHALEDDIQRRLDARAFPGKVIITVQLGFVTER